MTGSGDSQTTYVIDTCSLTEMHRRYPVDMMKPVWGHVEKLIQDGIATSIEDVFIELSATDDGILEWAKKQKEIGFFRSLDSNTQKNASRVLSSHGALLDLRKRKSSADAFLIGYAIHARCTVVTQEKKSGGPPKVKIPDVCEHYDIPCIDLVTFLRQTGFSMDRVDVGFQAAEGTTA